MVDGVGEQVADPLGEHDGGHDQEQELDVVGDLHHDDRQRHGQPGHAGEKRDSAEQSESTRVHPVPAVDGTRCHTTVVVVDAKDVNYGAAEEAAVQGSNEQHWDDEAAGDLCAGRPAGEEEV